MALPHEIDGVGSSPLAGSASALDTGPEPRIRANRPRAGPGRAEWCPSDGPDPNAMTEPTPHPHFDDKGTLHWHTRLADALAQAAAEGKQVFIELGREL